MAVEHVHLFRRAHTISSGHFTNLRHELSYVACHLTKNGICFLHQIILETDYYPLADIVVTIRDVA